MKPKLLFSTFILILLAAVSAEAQQQPSHTELVAFLEPALEKCEWKIRTLTAGPKGVMLLHRVKMERFLEQLKAGQSIDSKEIDGLLKEHSG